MNYKRLGKTSLEYNLVVSDTLPNLGNTDAGSIETKSTASSNHVQVMYSDPVF